MKVVVARFESNTHDFVLYKDVIAGSRASRILVDMAIRQAEQQALIARDKDGDLYLTDAGKHFAIQHKLVR